MVIFVYCPPTSKTLWWSRGKCHRLPARRISLTIPTPTHPKSGALMNWLNKRLYKSARERAVEEIVARGFSLVKGSEIPLNARNARRLVDRITDEQITIKGGDVLKNLWKWIVDHKEQIMELQDRCLSLVTL